MSCFCCCQRCTWSGCIWSACGYEFTVEMGQHPAMLDCELDSAHQAKSLLPEGTTTHLAAPGGQKSHRASVDSTSSSGFSRLGENFEVGAALKKVPLLRRLTDTERAKLGSVFHEARFDAGTVVFKQGDVGTDFYIIKQGSAIVSRTDFADCKQQHEHIIATLSAGDYFGETALTNKSEKRGASITAEGPGPLICLRLGKPEFVKTFGTQRLNVQFAKRNAISSEVFENVMPEHSATKSGCARKVREKSESTKKLIRGAVKKNVLFSNLDEEQTFLIVEEMYKREVTSGMELITQGERGDNFYVVEKGNFDIFVARDGKSKKVTTRGPGTSFGELALMYNSPRAATVRATEDCVVWAVARHIFRKIVMKISADKLTDYENFLLEVNLFQPLLTNERARIAEALEEVTFDDGENVVEQGEEGETFYIVRSGRAVVMKKEPGMDYAHEVARYKAGDYFGERALIKSEPRAATVTAIDGPLQCLTLDLRSFTLLLGPLKEILDQRMQGYNKPINKRMSEPGGAKFVDVKRPDLKVIGTLGKGSFGHVQLVRDSKSGQTYALKSVSKAQVVQLGQQDHIMSEKRVMARMNNKFLINLCATYNSPDTLYFLLEVSLGGELFSILRNRTIFDEGTARFFAASVVCAFEYMHSKKIIYRDLKPENLLLDNKGYLKITDFGFAKVVNDRTWTLCGTPDYLAPEVVSGQGHGKGVDWWTLGILLYEMLAAYPPFYDEDPMKTYAKIMRGKVTYPKHFSANASDLISKLLHPKPTKRLGVVKGGAVKVKQHPWFDGFSWKALEEGTMVAPIIPQILGDDDLTNFEEYPDEVEEHLVYEDDGSNWDRDF